MPEQRAGRRREAMTAGPPVAVGNRQRLCAHGNDRSTPEAGEETLSHQPPRKSAAQRPFFLPFSAAMFLVLDQEALSAGLRFDPGVRLRQVVSWMGQLSTWLVLSQRVPMHLTKSAPASTVRLSSARYFLPAPAAELAGRNDTPRRQSRRGAGHYQYLLMRPPRYTNL